MNEPFDATPETMRQSAEALRRLTLWCSILALRLGDGLSDTAVQTMPDRLTPYQLPESLQN